jgi:hypothetical protein
MSTSPEQLGIPSTATDLELLRAFEPIVHYTSGEQFFPMAVEPYIESCSLWLYHPDDRDEELIPEGELTMERLVEARKGGRSSSSGRGSAGLPAEGC